MSIKNDSQNVEKKEWKRILVPKEKLAYIYTVPDTAKCALSFEIADDKTVAFMVSSKLVSVNSDRTGFVISLPVGEVKLSKYIPGADGAKGTRQELVAEKIEDLGYPFAK